MKILIITTNVGRTAPGIVFERLIQGLASSHEVDVLTSDYDPSIDLSQVGNTFICKRTHTHPRIYKLLISIFGINPYDHYWARRSIKHLKKWKRHYDLVFSFLSFHHYEALIIGTMLATMYGYKLAVYSVDAVPAPPGWPENPGYYKGVKKMVGNYLKYADAFFSANKMMLAYQLSTFKAKANLITDVLYNPAFGGVKQLPLSILNEYHFLYTGGLYGARKADYLLEGFEKLLEVFPESYLDFVGGRPSENSLAKLEPATLERIKIHPFTKDLNPYYASSTALIDIDADLENDVFLSSKIINYLLINKVIISETGNNSPSRHLFKGIDSIIQCGHNGNELLEAMKRAIIINGKITFEDRGSVIDLFALQNVINRLNNVLEELEY